VAGVLWWISVVLCIVAGRASAGPLEFGRAELNAALEARGLAATSLRITTEVSADLPEVYRIEKGRIFGGDLRGLMYGLLEAADQIRTQGKLTPVQARAAMPIRGIRVLAEIPRLRPKESWISLIQMLARARFNRLHVVFEEIPRDERSIESVRFISQSAADHGIDFALGIRGTVTDGLTEVLRSCPAIRSVGINPIGPQNRDALLQAVRDAGRLIHVEWSGPLQPGALDAARAARTHLRLSASYSADRTTRPFQPVESAVYENLLERTPDPIQQETTPLPMLNGLPKLPRRMRPYEFYWQLQGVQRMLLWGDPDFVRRAVRTFTVADTQGFEIDAPQGVDCERHWLFYLLWGRLSYDPDTPERVSLEELRRRFGVAAPDVLDAYKSASRVAREIPAAESEFGSGGSIQSYGEKTARDRTFTATPREAVHHRVAGISSAKRTPVASASQLDAMSAALESAIARVSTSATAEWKASEIDFKAWSLLARYHARKLRAADELISSYETGSGTGLHAAHKQLTEAAAVWKGLVKLTEEVYPGQAASGLSDVEHDLTLIADRLALHKQFGNFEQGYDFGGQSESSLEPRFQLVTPEMTFTEEAGYGWKAAGERKAQPLAKAAPLQRDLLYGDSIRGTGEQIFRVKIAPGSYDVYLLRPNEDNLQRSVEAQAGYMDIAMPSGLWGICGIVIKRLGEPKPALPQIQPQLLPRPVIEHTPPLAFTPGQPLTLAFKMNATSQVTSVRLRYRPLNSLEKVRTQTVEGARGAFTIPASDLIPSFDLQYWFEVLHDRNGGWFYPDPEQTAPYFIVRPAP
jgi:hypothetical protein